MKKKKISDKKPPLKPKFSKQEITRFIIGGYDYFVDGENGDKIKKIAPSSYGVVSTIAKRMNRDWHTAEKNITKHNLWGLLEAEREPAAEFVFSKMMQNVANNDNVAIAMAFKILKSKRYSIETESTKIELTGRDGKDLVPTDVDKNIKFMTPTQIASLVDNGGVE